MSGKMSRNKGSRGEREAAELLVSWLTPVYGHAGVEAPSLKRNLMQSRQGGYDLVGIDWLALEVKRHEQLAVGSWWKQTIRQAGESQVPFLMYRQNHGRWQFRVRLICLHCGPAGDGIARAYVDADLGQDAAQEWLQKEAWYRLTGEHWT